MRRTTSHRNFFPTSSGGSSAVSASGSSRFTSRESPPPPPPPPVMRAQKSGGSSAVSASGSSESPPPPDDESTKKVRKTGIAKVVAENSIVIVAVLGCFMCVTVNGLMQKLGVNPKIVEVKEAEKTATLVQLAKIEDGSGGPWELPAVYIGGKLLGGVDKVMEAHLNGEFVPMLRAAGAIWL